MSSFHYENDTLRYRIICLHKKSEYCFPMTKATSAGHYTYITVGNRRYRGNPCLDTYSSSCSENMPESCQCPLQPEAISHSMYYPQTRGLLSLTPCLPDSLRELPGPWAMSSSDGHLAGALGMSSQSGNLQVKIQGMLSLCTKSIKSDWLHFKTRLVHQLHLVCNQYSHY